MTALVVERAPGFAFPAGADVAARTRMFHDARGQPAAEWLRWMVALDDQVIMNKDGSLMAVYELTGLDLDSASNGTVNQARGQVMYALEQVQELGATVWWQVRRRRTTDYPSAVFPDAVSQHVDDALRTQFLSNTQYVNRHHVTLCVAPQGQGVRMMNMLRRSQEANPGVMGGLRALWGGLSGALKGESAFPYDDMGEVAEALEQFHKVVDQFGAAMSSVGLRALRADELGGFLEVASSPTSPLDTTEPLPEDTFLDDNVAKAIIDNGYRDVLHFEWNDQQVWAKAYSLDISRRKTLSMDMLDALMAAPFEYTLSHVFELLPRGKGERAVAEHERYHATRKYPLRSYLMAAFQGGDMEGAPVNQVREDQAAEAEALKNNVSMGRTGVGRYYGVVLVQADSPRALQEAGAQCEELLQSLRIRPVHERTHKLSSFASTVPGSQGEIALWKKITTANFVDLCPVRTLQSGARHNAYLTEQLQQPCGALLALPTRHRTPFYFTGYEGDLGHGMMIGPSGTGKTSFVNLCWTMYRKYPGARVIVFDKDWSVRPPLLLQGGRYLDLAGDGNGPSGMRARMNPIRAMLEGQGERHFSFVVNWLELLIQQRGYRLTGQDSIELQRVVRATIAQGVERPQNLRLSTIIVQLHFSSPLAQALQPWTEGQVNGMYFDNEEDNLSIDQLVAIENGSILASDELSAPYMFYVFYKIQAMLQDTKDREGQVSPTFIYVPEMWFFLRNETFRNKFYEFLVTLRKLNGVVWLDTQSPDQLVQSSIYSALRDNIATTIFTPNRKALTGSLGELYRKEFLLSDEELQFVASGTPKRDYFIKQGGLSRRISLQLPPSVVSCLRSDKRAQTVLDRQIGAAGSILPSQLPGQTWQDRYLQELNDV